MGINEHATEFAGLPIRDYNAGEGLRDPNKTAWRITLGSEAYDAPEPLTNLLAKFLDERGVDKAPAIVIGTWEDMATGETSGAIVEALVAAAGRLPNLKGLFFGDVVLEECEISWIIQSNMGPLLAAYPRLEYFRVRGGQGLSLGALKHDCLRSLIIESGGLGADVVRQVAAADLPALQHLELWLGSEAYGGDFAMKDLEPLLEGRGFPHLRYLGLRDSEKADDIAEALAKAPILARIAVLDLSLGNLSDRGGEALLATPTLKALNKLDLHHHYLSDGMMKRLSALGIDVDLGERQEADRYDGEEYRYIAVSE